MNEEQRINLILSRMDPREAEMVAQNLKKMPPEERVGFLM
jgi:flagellar motility protein MotE (MotC chaperone)